MLENIKEVKKLRKKFDLTQKKLANLAGISQSIIAKIESQKLDPSFSIMNKISEILENFEKNKIVAKDIMNKNIIKSDYKANVLDIVENMIRHKISQIPVYKDKKLIGIITERDILFAKKEDPIEKYLSNDFIILQENSSLVHIKNLLIDYPIILIMNKARITGIITKSDVLSV